MSSLLIKHIDVGQGDCTVIMYFDDNATPVRSILLDCGEGRAYKEAYQTLNRHGFQKLDVVLITHYDEDHFIGIKHWLEEALSLGKMSVNTLLEFFSGTIFWDRGDIRCYSSGEISSSGNTTYDNYVRLLREVATMQRARGIAPVRRMTRNMSRVLPGSSKRVTSEELQALGIYEEPSDWAWVNLPNCILEEFENDVPHEEISSSRGRSSKRSWVLWKKRSWAIGFDVANFGFANPIDLSIDILVGNGFGIVNQQQRDVTINNKDSDEMKAWKQSLGPMRTSIKQSRDENDLGMGYLLKYHDMRYWFGGDLTSGVEDALTDAIGQLSILKAGHHGSKKSTSRRFLFETKPRVVTISTASNSNDTVGLPHLETLQSLNQSPEVENVYLTGAPYDDDMIPGHNDLYDPSNKFRVAGTRHFPSDITMETNSMDAQGDPVFWFTYHEKNLVPTILQLGRAGKPNLVTNTHQKEMPQ